MGEVITLPRIRIDRGPDEPPPEPNPSNGAREALHEIFPNIDAGTIDWMLIELYMRGFILVPMAQRTT